MNGFISHIISRHMHTDVNVTPRLRGRFEPPPGTAIPDYRKENEPAVETRQPTTHFHTGKSMEDHHLQSGDKKTDPVQTMDTVESNWKTEHIKSEGTLQPPFEQQVADSKEALDIQQKNRSAFVPSRMYFTQNRPAIAYVNAQQQPGPQLIYEPAPADQQENSETGGKSLPVVSPDVFKPAPGKRDDTQPAFIRTPVSVVTPASRRSGSALHFSGSGFGEQQPPQVIKVSIGRIEVKAVGAATPVKTTRAEIPKPNMSLDEYLNKRDNSRS